MTRDLSDSLLAGATRTEVAVEGVRFALHRAEPPSPTQPPVLLLHGVPQTSAVYRHLFPVLAADRVVLAPDLKGLGASEACGPYDVPTLVAELAALILHEVDGPVDVVGHDWGGVLALHLAEVRPDLVRRMVVVNAPYRRINLARAFHIPLLALPVLPELAFRLLGRRLVDGMLALAWKASEPLEPHVQDRYAAAYTDPQRVSAMLGYYRASVRRQLSRAAGDSEPPPRATGLGRLVLWGAADPVMPMSIAESVCHDLGPAAELVALPGVGHFPLEEAAEDSVQVISRFLDAGVAGEIDLTVAATVSLHEAGLTEEDETETSDQA
jgi:pimeloyl-ACP methyl ester carboxylesterase